MYYIFLICFVVYFKYVVDMMREDFEKYKEIDVRYFIIYKYILFNFKGY